MNHIPTAQQIDWQRNHAFALFFHFGINTFYGKEWSDGTLDPAGFNPDALDCRQWVSVAKQAGAAHVILTAKHHDGFCLWPTATTDYSVASTPWKNGQGDVVRELADACAEAGVGLGLYLSPWDRHDPDWSGDPARYDARYIQQLTELCTQYGPLVELWFDGAGSEQHPYDWPAIMAVAKTHQPDALIFNMGDPTIRWVGNEDGLAVDPCWYTVDSVGKSIYDDTKVGLQGGDRYCPPECDVAIRRNWFWQTDDVDTLKSVEHLLAIWYRSIGLGANLLLNVPPDRHGLIDTVDAERLSEFTGELERRFADPMPAEVVHANGSVTVRFPGPVTIDHLRLEEVLESGQRVSAHRVVLPDGSSLVEGVFTIGSQRVHAFPAVTVQDLKVELEGEGARLRAVIGYRTGHESAPSLEQQPEMKPEKFS